jgi:phospholipid/cholesterol/gamma-HCH transport system substrate-binding protein
MAELEIKPTPAMKGRVAAVMLSAGTLVAVLVWLLTGGGVGLFARKVDLRTYMPDATALAVGAPVRISGIHVGTVKRIVISPYLDYQRAVQVDLRVERSFLSQIPADSLTSIGSDTLIGDKFVDIAAGQSTRPVEAGSLLASEPSATAADKADLIYSIQDSMRKVDTILQDVANPDSPTGHYITGDKEYTQILSSLDDFERSMRSLVALSNPAGQMVFSTSLYAGWDKSLHQIDDTLQSIQKGEGVAGRLYTSDEQYNAILSQVQSLRKSIAQFRDEMTKAAPGLRDEETYRKITSMLASTDSMLSALNRGEGKTGELLNSPQVYESLVGSLKSLQDFLRDFRGDPKKYLRVKVFGRDRR